nr:ferritin [uncultured Prevotella sp.]
MNISKKMQDAFNKQIIAEFWSSNLYIGMAFWLRQHGWRGFSDWMYRQSQEERGHALDMASYVLSRGGEVKMTAIENVPADWKGPEDIFEATFKHEQEVTSLINKLADVADEEKDRASQNFIAKYIDEQVEEESSVSEILDLFRQLPDHAISFIEKRLETQK